MAKGSRSRLRRGYRFLRQEPRSWLLALVVLLGLVAAPRVAVGGIIGFVTAVFADPLRRWVYRPELKLEFDEDVPGCKLRTPERSKPTDTQSMEREAYYVRVKVANAAASLARGCRAYLVNVERRDHAGEFQPTDYCDTIPLPWSYRGEQAYRPVDLPNGVVQFVDLLSTRSDAEEFQPAIRPFPYAYRGLFREHGQFRFTVQVSGENVAPTRIRITFDWLGGWNDFSVQRDEEA